MFEIAAIAIFVAMLLVLIRLIKAPRFMIAFWQETPLGRIQCC